MGSSVIPLRQGLTLAAASKRFRVITKDEILRRIEAAVQLDRQARTDSLHEEAKSRIVEARSALQEAIRQIERMKGREAELLARAESLQNENLELREQLRHFVETAKRPDAAHANGNGSALLEKAAWDSLAARLTRVEDLLSAHLIQDHRGQGDDDPPESNGRSKRRRLR